MKFSSQTTDNDWNGLYKIGGFSALVMVAITLTQFAVFVTAPPPIGGNASDWFELFRRSAWLGLLSFEFLLVIYALLSILVSVALFAALRYADQSLTVVFLVLSVIAGIAFIVARPALEMLVLSNQYSAATTDVQRAAALAAGESMVALFHGTAFQVGYVVGSIAGILIAAVMLRSSVFSATTAYVRIGSSIFDFGIFIPRIGLYISLLSVAFLILFNILIARRFLQISRVPPGGGPLRGTQ